MAKPFEFKYEKEIPLNDEEIPYHHKGKKKLTKKQLEQKLAHAKKKYEHWKNYSGSFFSSVDFYKKQVEKLEEEIKNL